MHTPFLNFSPTIALLEMILEPVEEQEFPQGTCKDQSDTQGASFLD